MQGSYAVLESRGIQELISRPGKSCGINIMESWDFTKIGWLVS